MSRFVEYWSFYTKWKIHHKNSTSHRTDRRMLKIRFSWPINRYCHCKVKSNASSKWCWHGSILVILREFRVISPSLILTLILAIQFVHNVVWCIDHTFLIRSYLVQNDPWPIVNAKEYQVILSRRDERNHKEPSESFRLNTVLCPW